MSNQAADQIDHILPKIVAQILSVGNPERIILFGSQARGDIHVGSDVDLLVIEPSGQPRYKRAVRYRRALTGLGPAKDIVVWTPDEVAEWQKVPNAFITMALNEGIVLYERDQ